MYNKVLNMLTKHILNTTTHILVVVILASLVIGVVCSLLGVNNTIKKHDYGIEKIAEHFFASALFFAVVLMFLYLIKFSGLVTV
jgi:TRAP-type C4-dicarboxylate transport system permease small subunit